MEKVAIIRETEPTELSTIYQLSNSLTNLSMSDSNFFSVKYFASFPLFFIIFFITHPEVQLKSEHVCF